MFWLLAADAVFLAALSIEALAVVSLAVELAAFVPKPELAHVLSAYREWMAGLCSLMPEGVLPSRQAFGDAYIVSFIWFFLFTIRQARIASAPPRALAGYDGALTGIERAIDAGLPALVCALAGAVASFTLLPLFTPVAALAILSSGAIGRPPWFKISRAFHVNLASVCLLVITLFAVS